MRLPELFSARSEGASLTLDEWASFFKWGGNPWLREPTQGTLGAKQEEIERSFEGYVYGAYKANGTVFACMLARQLLFTEARFQFRRRAAGRPGELFGTKALEPLEEPWPGGTTGNLLARAIQDVDLAGNHFAARRRGGRIKRMRPDWVTIVLGSNSDPEVGFGDLDVEVLGYVYTPGGPHSGRDPIALLPFEVAHFAPIKDPLASFRGMSWLTPILREVMGDSAATEHKLKFFEQGATPSMVVNFDANVQREALEAFLERFTKEYEGSQNAYKTMILAQGAKAEVVGSDLKSIDFRAVQQAGENRIANAAGVPGIIVGLAEGLKAATLANYGQARRHFADATVRPLWREVCGAFAPIIQVPKGTELWYDDRDISYLQEDQKDEAEHQQAQAMTLKTLVEAGYTPDSAQSAIVANDMSRLVHSGLVSVQLQPPGSEQPSAVPAAE